MQIGDKVKYVGSSPFGELKGEIARFSDCKYFGHEACEERLLSLTEAPNIFYHVKNFVLTD